MGMGPQGGQDEYDDWGRAHRAARTNMTIGPTGWPRWDLGGCDGRPRTTNARQAGRAECLGIWGQGLAWITHIFERVGEVPWLRGLGGSGSNVQAVPEALTTITFSVMVQKEAPASILFVFLRRFVLLKLLADMRYSQLSVVFLRIVWSGMGGGLRSTYLNLALSYFA